MERWGVRDRVCAVELFIRTGSITETQRGFLTPVHLSIDEGGGHLKHIVHKK